MGMCVVSFFFFFKQKTAYEMRISDWSSDVCSSDLEDGNRGAGGQGQCAGEDQEAERGVHRRVLGSGRVAALLARVAMVGCGGPLAVVRRARAGAWNGRPWPVVRKRIVLHAGRDVSAARRRALLPRRSLSGQELPGQDSTQTRLRPSSLARYSAASAAAIRPARLSCADDSSAMPMLMVICCDSPPGVNVSASTAVRRRSAKPYAATVSPSGSSTEIGKA